MNVFGWVLIVCFVVLAVAIITLSVLRFATNMDTVEYLSPDLATLFRQMTNNDNIALATDKPFRIKSETYIAPSVDAFTVDTLPPEPSMLQDNIIGFVFTMQQPVQMTDVQILARCLVATNSVPRNITVFEYESKQELRSSILDPRSDPIDENGFYTHSLGDPLLLNPGVRYVIVAQSIPMDVVLSTPVACGMVVTHPIVMESGAETLGASVLSFPVDFPVQPRVFVSFRTRKVTTTEGGATVFGVEPSNGGYPSSPPSYLSGFLVSVASSSTTSIIVQAGAGCSQDNTSMTMLLNQPVRVDSTKNGLNGLDVGTLVANRWYNVFVISSEDAQFPTGCLLSLGRVAPVSLPQHYIHFRRIGTVRTRFDLTFFTMQQENLGRRRTTFFAGNATDRNFISEGTTSDEYKSATVDMVPPTATEMTIGVNGLMQDDMSFPGVTPINAIVNFRPAGSPTKTSTLGIPNNIATYGQLDVELQNNFIPQMIEYRLFPKPNTNGSIPNTPEQRFVINCFVIKYVENL